jgi:sarcosine oxidase subunit beta
MTETADVVVVGGGVVGASAAYHLAAAGAGRVLMLEREDTLGTGSTGACAGGFRHQFSSEVNIRLSLASVPMILSFRETHGIPLDVHQDGYLFLVRSEASWRSYVAAAELQRGLGVDARLLQPEGAGALAPGISLDGIVGATFCPDDGIADPSGLTAGYATIARGAGAELRTGVEAFAILKKGERITGVDTSEGPVFTDIVVNAAGPWAGLLAKTCGVALPLEPVPRNVVVTGPFPGAPDRKTLVVDADTSFYFHREGSGVLMGMGSPNERASFDTTVDEAMVENELVPTAVRVFPPLDRAGIVRMWAGLYEMTPDRHPIVGTVGDCTGLFLACGFSGHGFQHAPIVGKLLAEMIVEGQARSVDVSALSLDRFGRGDLAREGHVV